jgi:beta-glucosidase-like glycosyl hydrolase/CubicO group peptidase (beta-lactamase class C family)
MSLAEKLGQLLMVPCFGRFTSAESAEHLDLMRAVSELHVGGFMLATRPGTPGIARAQVYPTAALANELQTHAKVPLLFGADFERGTVMRIEEGTSFPHAMAVAATGAQQDAYEVGRVTAIEARAAGIHWIFAPDADVNSNPVNPIINTRSFGEDPRHVAEFVSAFTRGVEENGALATAKHFPGHGDTSTDSHLDLPRANADRKRLERVELVPFRAAIAAGASAIMTGHLSVPALEPDSELPATLSPLVLTDLLREELGFRGLIITDALDMAGVAKYFSPGEIAVRAILAGADVLLMPPAPDAALAALHAALKSGRLSVARVNQSVERILAAKARMGLHTKRDVSLRALGTVFAKAEYAAAAQRIADRGVTLLRNDKKLLPLDATRRLRVLLVAVAADPDANPAEALECEIRRRVDSLEVVRVDSRFSPAALAKLPPAGSFDIIIVAMLVRVADRKDTIALPAEQIQLTESLAKLQRPVIIACFGSPYLIERFARAPVWISAFSTAEVAQRAVGRAIFGEITVGGKLPVGVPGSSPPLHAGTGLLLPANPMTLRAAGKDRESRLAPVYDFLGRSVEDHAFPGGVLAVGCKGELWTHAFGRQTYETSAAKVKLETIYDVASLTKPVVTATLVAIEVEAGRLSLDAPIGNYLAEWNSGPLPDWRRRVTLRHLLTHTSGLPGYVTYYQSLKSKDEMIAQIHSERLLGEPGTKTEYSDPGFMLLGEIIERVTGREISSLAHEQIFSPLGMTSSMYNPPRSLRARIAPTGRDSPLRKHMLHGEAHDDNTWAMGGIAAHAGLFSTAGDLAAFCQMMLNGGIYAHRRLLRRATITEFTTAQPLSDNTRALGWVVPTEPSASGRYFSSRSFGHAGFTGASIWCDPEKNLFVVLLTNRVHPVRTNEKIQQVRPALHDAVAEALGVAAARRLDHG